MLRRVRNLFARYAARHLRVEGALPDIPADTNIRLARVALADGRLVVEGQAPGAEVVLEHGAAVARARVEGGMGGFHLSLPYGGLTSVLRATSAGAEAVVPLPAFSPAALRLARLRLCPGFVGAMLGALPAVVDWYRYRDPAARAEVKERLGLGPRRDLMGYQRGLLSPPPERGAEGAVGANEGITIVLPVYNALALLQEALRRVEVHTDLDWHLVLVEDASTDPDVRPWVRDWAGARAGRVTLIENDRNLGFVGTANRGLDVARGRGGSVVLLNSDAMLPRGWASRLIAPLLRDASVASVTPMSNDAELMSVPVTCQPMPLDPGEGDAIDALAARFDPRAGLVEAPTGVGFCMAMSPAFLEKVPAFDTAFGRGYGEEVDWCRKTAALGGRHLCLPGLFVEHRSGASFGTAAKQALLQQNGALISARYPDFDLSVDRFLQGDPLRSARLLLGLGWAAARAGEAPVPVYLGHSMGGGAEAWLERQIEEHIAGQGTAVVIRVGAVFPWQVELHSAAGVTEAGCADAAEVEEVLSVLRARRVVYSCAVEAAELMEVPGLLVRLSAGAAHRLDVMVHDYLPVSPHYTLVGKNSVYAGVPDPEDAAARDHRLRRRDGTEVALRDWRAAWGALIEAADSVVVFSEASRDIMTEAFPDSTEGLVVRPHALLHHVPQIPPGAGWQGKPVIGVLGNIGPHKGADVLTYLARHLARTGAARLVVIGQLDPGYALSPPAVVHGSYTLDELPSLVARYGITSWFIPSVWPEAFSYATHEAIATGLPVHAFDLGAQGGAVARAAEASGRGGVIDLPSGDHHWVEHLLANLPSPKETDTNKAESYGVQA